MHPSHARLLVCLLLVACIWSWPTPGWAQNADAPADPDSTGIVLNFPENVPLTTLIAYVSKRLDLNILYDEAQVNQRITLKTPSPIPETALLDLLGTVLQARHLLLQDTPVPGLKRIVPAQQLPEVANLALPGDGAGEGGAVTQVFALQHARAERVIGLIVPFVTKPGGNVTVLPEEQLIVVTDYAANLDRIAGLIALIDTPRSEPVIRPIPIEHGDAAALLKVVQPLVQARARASGDPRAAQSVMVTSDPRTNQLIVVGPPDQVDPVVELVESLDVSRQMERQVYRPQVVPPDRLDALIKAVLSPKPSEYDYRAAADPKGGTLVVTAPPQIHAQIARLLEELDALPAVEQQPVRFYKLTNTVAEDVLATIRMLEGSGGAGGGYGRGNGDRPRRTQFLDQVLGGDNDRNAGRNRRSRDRGRDDPVGYYQLEEQEQLFRADVDTPLQPVDPADPTLTPVIPDSPFAPDAEADASDAASVILRPDDGEQQATIAADRNTNTIIVIAPPAQQRMYAKIIEKLDQRRPQVLIETTIVTLDTSENFELGVEIGASDEGDDGRVISFSAFGLSDLDPQTGALTPIEAPGGTLALLGPDIADVVIRALSSSSRARLVSMPRILVNDNEPGLLTSENVEPFATTVINDGTTLVGQGGQATAGTTIQVIPHISDDDYLQLEYAVELSSFTGQRQTNLPPPSQVNTIESRVTIPHGHTIVVGGLNRTDLRETITKVPLLGDIPLIKHLFRSQINDSTNITLFIFIRPTILRDDQFRDLKHLSELDREAADVDDDFPDSEPLLIYPLR